MGQVKPNSLEYQKSIAREFEATKNRVRHLIGSAHWGEEGRYKEIILMNFLRGFLPNTLSVGTGFIKDENMVSTQLDIIIYNPIIANYYLQDDFVIIHPTSVVGIIEVKSNPDKNKIAEAIDKATSVGRLIEHPIFNGVFIFGNKEKKNNNSNKLLDNPTENSKFRLSLIDALKYDNGLNHLVSNDGVFLKKWNEDSKFQSYEISELATSYFFSNLLSHISKIGIYSVADSMYEHLYPIKKGKGTYAKWCVPE